MINTVSNLAENFADSHSIRSSALRHKVLIQTTIAGAGTYFKGIESLSLPCLYEDSNLHQQLTQS